MRINKYIAASGIASRRKADELIAEGKVKVNGAVLKQPGYDVVEGDKVQVDGHLITASEELVYYMLNKPVGYVTTTADEHDRLTVLDLMSDVTARVYPVGRLDYDSAGLLIMTNDGELSNHIAHPKNKVWKTYMAEVAGQLNLDKIRELQRGVLVDGRMTAKAKVKLLKQKGDMSLVEVQIYEGRNRQVRKMFEAVSCKVTFLQRTQVGELKLGRLHEGDYRKLTREEIEYLKNC
ncbi:MAG: pseudouridine synthase [Bacillota bacterium]|nr:pseudouridine synthase [Bacillota bacterium]